MNKDEVTNNEEDKRRKIIKEIIDDEIIKPEIDKRVNIKVEEEKKLIMERANLLELAKKNDISKFNNLKVFASSKYDDVKDKISLIENNVGSMNIDEIESTRSFINDTIDIENGLRNFKPNANFPKIESYSNSESDLPESIGDILKNPESYSHCRYRDGLYKTPLDYKTYDSFSIGDHNNDFQRKYMEDQVLKDYVEMVQRNKPFEGYSKIR